MYEFFNTQYMTNPNIVYRVPVVCRFLVLHKHFRCFKYFIVPALGHVLDTSYFYNLRFGTVRTDVSYLATVKTCDRSITFAFASAFASSVLTLLLLSRFPSGVVPLASNLIHIGCSF